MSQIPLKYKMINFKNSIIAFFEKYKISKKHNYDKRKSVCNLIEIKNNIIAKSLNEILLFAIIRNEALRLPHFLKYYKDLGIDHFFIIDNNSEDNSIELLKNENNIHIFLTKENYANHWLWMEYLLDTYGKNHWCMVVDIDELFSYPNSDKIKLKELIIYFEKNNFSSITSLLLDVYSKNNFLTIRYKTGENPLNTLKFYDTNYYKSKFSFWDKKNFKPVVVDAFTGGMRERVFGIMYPLDILTKTSFFKYEKDVYLIQGMHAITNTNQADIEGIVFHTKFLNDFIAEVKEETVRGQHYDNAIRYKHYEATIDKNENLNFYYEGSVEYKNNEQLIELGLMKTSEQFEAFCKNIDKVNS